MHKSAAIIFRLLLIVVLGFAPQSAIRDVSAQQDTPDRFLRREDAYRANNLGVAQLEQFNYAEAAKEFRRALSINPELAIAQINLAIALFDAQDVDGALKAATAAAALAPKRPQVSYLLGMIARVQNRDDDAVELFKKVLAIDPADVGVNVNLGQIYTARRDFQSAEAVLRRAVEAEPYNSTALYNLATVLLRNNAGDEGRQLMTRFQSLRQSGAATSLGQTYLEQGRYAEAIVSTGAETELVDERAPQVVFRKRDGFLPLSAAQGARAPLSDSLPPPKTAALLDFNGDGQPDLIKIDERSARLFRGQNGKFIDVTQSSSDLARPLGMRAFGVVAGDYNNDNSADLLIFGAGGVRLFSGDGKGRFTDATLEAKIPTSEAASIAGAFVDVDHDGDLDIFLAGFATTGRPSEPAANRLLRNNGDGTFTDISEKAGVALPARAVAVIPTDYDNRRDVDILVLNRGAVPMLFRNLRDRTFRDVAGEVGLNQSGEWTSAAAGDVNKDGFTDFFFGRSGKIGIFALSDGRGKFSLAEAPAATEDAASAQFADYDNDGLLDLIVISDRGISVTRNLGSRWQATAAIAVSDKAVAGSRQMLSADGDGDGDLDLMALNTVGGLSYFENVGGSINKSEIVRLQGRVSNRSGVGAKVEIRAGSLTQKLEYYAASPSPAPSQVHFGIGRREKPDAVRVIWPSGTLQAEVNFPEPKTSVAVLKIEELDRKPSSCPYLYTWNGQKFEFVTDFLGGGESGSWQSDGVYNYPDPDERVRITSEQLKPKDGKYQLRVTNELEEVLFLDKIKLVAIEHAAGTEVYPNEGLGIPTAGQQILYTTGGESAPLAATDADGKNVLPAIKKLDRVFYDSFRPQNLRGYAAPHSLTLNLDEKKGYRGRTLLLLSGWTDYAFSSDNVAASQSGRSLFLPKLQVRDKNGNWKTMIESIGISVGRPQTVVVDLTSKFLTDSREVRIVTNYKTYWDKIAVDTSSQSDVKTIELETGVAALRERGFSREIKYGEMIAADYARLEKDARWKYFSGAFTRIGDVLPLLNESDDLFVISKTGDEIVLTFDALPDPPPGKKYTFLLYANGYSKEMDINSGSPEAVLPLPFKAMTRYPYGADEQFPMTDEKRRIYDEYTTRLVTGGFPRLESSLLK